MPYTTAASTSKIPDKNNFDCNSTAVSKKPNNGSKPIANGEITTIGKDKIAKVLAAVRPSTLVATPLLG